MNRQPADCGLSGGTATLASPAVWELVRARTFELALIAGRGAHQIKQVDYERAKRELTGESDFDRQQALLYPADPQ